MTFATIPGDCIDRVTSDGGDRELFRTSCNSKATSQGNVEQELAMPEQHSTSGTDVPGFWEQIQKSGDLTEVQDGSKHILEVDQASGNLEQSVSTKDEIHTDDVEIITSTFPCEDANYQIIERIEVGAKKIAKIW